MSHSITFHCVCFEIYTVPRRETIQGSRSWKSSSVFFRCLVWIPRKNRKKLQVLMNYSITFHCVYFELSTVPERETIEGSRSRKSSPVVSRCLIWFPSKKSQKIDSIDCDFLPNEKIDLNGSINRLQKPWGALGKKYPLFPDIAMTKNFLYKGGPKELLPGAKCSRTENNLWNWKLLKMTAILGKSRSRCHSINQGTWDGCIQHPSP